MTAYGRGSAFERRVATSLRGRAGSSFEQRAAEVVSTSWRCSRTVWAGAGLAWSSARFAECATSERKTGLPSSGSPTMPARRPGWPPEAARGAGMRSLSIPCNRQQSNPGG